MRIGGDDFRRVLDARCADADFRPQFTFRLAEQVADVPPVAGMRQAPPEPSLDRLWIHAYLARQSLDLHALRGHRCPQSLVHTGTPMVARRNGTFRTRVITS